MNTWCAGLITPMQDRPCAGRPERTERVQRQRRTVPLIDSPEDLTAGMRAALSAVIQTGTDELAGQLLGLSPKTITAQLNKARDRMGLDKRLHVLLAYDRWVRAHRGEVA